MQELPDPWKDNIEAVNGDQFKYTQILVNLLNNSVLLSKPFGKVTIILTINSMISLSEDNSSEDEGTKMEINFAVTVKGTPREPTPGRRSHNLVSYIRENGDVVEFKDLLYGLMLPSGNDAAWALATWFGKFI